MKDRLDFIIGRFQKYGYQIVPFRSENLQKLERAFLDIHDDYEAVCISGGDGTLSSVVNMMASKKIDMPIGIFPFGTANDFATHLNIPRNLGACCDIVKSGNIKKLDIGKVNNSYFLNVSVQDYLRGGL